MMLFLSLLAGITLLAYAAARLLLRRLSGLRTTQSVIALSTLYFLVVLQLAKVLIGGGA